MLRSLGRVGLTWKCVGRRVWDRHRGSEREEAAVRRSLAGHLAGLPATPVRISD